MYNATEGTTFVAFSSGQDDENEFRLDVSMYNDSPTQERPFRQCVALKKSHRQSKVAKHDVVFLSSARFSLAIYHYLEYTKKQRHCAAVASMSTPQFKAELWQHNPPRWTPPLGPMAVLVVTKMCNSCLVPYTHDGKANIRIMDDKLKSFCVSL